MSQINDNDPVTKKESIINKLKALPTSSDPLDSIPLINDFIEKIFVDEGIPYRTAFIETHVKKHFGFSSKVVSELISEMKSSYKMKSSYNENKAKSENNDFQLNVLSDEDKISDDVAEEAIKIIYTGDPVRFILDTHSSLHVGDELLAKSLLVSIGIQSVRNSDGIHPKVSGDSGKGKTHCCKVMMHLLPTKYKFKTTLSDKAIYYMDTPAGSVIFSDDVDLSDSLQGLIKRATSNFQEGDTYTTIDKNRNKQVLTIPPRVAWWLTSVDDDQSLQLLNRQFGGGVDESTEQDQAVYEFQKKLIKSGEVSLPENRNVQICRCIIDDLKKQLYTVIIPYADDLEWIDIANRRNFLIFADIVRSFAVLRHRQRYRTKDNEIIANIDDFNDAKELYVGRARTQGTKLTDAEFKLCEILHGAGEVDYHYLQEAMGVTQGRISQLINGKGKGDTGLKHKVKGFFAESQTIRTSDDVSVHRIVCRLDNFNSFDYYDTVITLKEGAEERFLSYYPTITRLLPEKNALPLYYITNINNYNKNISNKLINVSSEEGKFASKNFSVKPEKQGNMVIMARPITESEGNNGGNTPGKLPKKSFNSMKDERNHGNIVHKIIRSEIDGIKYIDLAVSVDLSKKQLDSIINSLKSSGRIFEPSIGLLKSIS